MTETLKSQILIIAGPGGTAYGTEQVKKIQSSLETSGTKVTLIGDGKNPIKLADLQRALDSLEVGVPTTFVIQSHGELENGHHVLCLEGGHPNSPYVYEGAKTPTAKIFDMISNRFADQPVKDHNAGGVSHTSKYMPWRVKTYLAFSNEKQALCLKNI
jgi:hypothetical protein